MPNWQQPLAQVLGPHEQVPVPGSQVCPTPHCGPLPHLHCPDTHCVAPEGLQALQAVPPDPQAVRVLPGAQLVPEQHPPGQLVALHTHTPLTQAWPATHCGFVPHLHAPPLQVSASAALQAAHAVPTPHCEVD